MSGSSSHQKDRLFEAIRRTPAPTRPARRARAFAIVALGLGMTATVFWLAGGLRAEPRPTSLILETAIGAAFIAGLASFGVAGHSGSPLGRGRRSLLLLITAIPLLLLGWKLSASLLHDGMTVAWPSRIGLRCLGLSLAMGLGPLLAMVVVWRDRDPVHPGVTGAALGITAGAYAWVLVDLWCPVAYLPHLLLGHVLPMTVLAILGAALGRKVIALRER